MTLSASQSDRKTESLLQCVCCIIKALFAVTIVDKDSPRLQYVLEQMEKMRKRDKEMERKMQTYLNPSGSHKQDEKNYQKGTKKGKVKFSLRYIGRNGGMERRRGGETRTRKEKKLGERMEGKKDAFTERKYGGREEKNIKGGREGC